MKKYGLNEISNNVVQIYGEVNGVAIRDYREGGGYRYIIDCKYFVRNKQIQIGFTMNDKDCTVSSLKRIRERIDREVEKDEEKWGV